MTEFVDDYRAFLTGGARFLQVVGSARYRRDVTAAQRLLAELDVTKDAQLERLDQIRRWWAFLQDEAIVTLRAATGVDQRKALDDLIASKTDQQRLIAQQLDLVNENAILRTDLARLAREADALATADTRAIRSLLGVMALPGVLLLALWLAR